MIIELTASCLDLNFCLQAYVQQLENSKLRLIQIEQEIERSRQQVLVALNIFLLDKERQMTSKNHSLKETLDLKFSSIFRVCA